MHRSRFAAGALALAAALVLAAAAQARGPQPGALELPGSRTATSSTYLNPDGSYTAVVAPRPVNYRDAAGAWQAIDTALVATKTTGYAYQNAAGPFRALLKGAAGDGFVRFDVGDATYALGLQNAARGASSAHGSSIDYRDAMPSTDIGYTVLATGITETITLSDARGPDTFRFTLSGAGGLDAASRPDGAVAFTEPGATRPAFVLSSPWAADTIGGRVVHAGETHPQLTAHRLGNGDWQIAVAVDHAWLSSPARTFPVVVDPTISIVAAQDAEFETSRVTFATTRRSSRPRRSPPARPPAGSTGTSPATRRRGSPGRSRTTASCSSTIRRRAVRARPRSRARRTTRRSRRDSTSPTAAASPRRPRRRMRRP